MGQLFGFKFCSALVGIVLLHSALFCIVLHRAAQNGAEPNCTVLHRSPLFCAAQCRTKVEPEKLAHIYKYIIYGPAFRVQVSFYIVLHCSTSCCAERCRTKLHCSASFCAAHCRTMQNRFKFCSALLGIYLYIWATFSGSTFVLHRAAQNNGE